MLTGKGGKGGSKGKGIVRGGRGGGEPQGVVGFQKNTS